MLGVARGRLAACITRALKRSLTAMWTAWCIEWALTQRSTRATRWWTDTTRVRAFMTWHVYAATYGTAMRRLRRVGARVHQRKLAEAYSTWAATAALTRKSERQLMSVVSRFTQRAVIDAFIEWEEAVEAATAFAHTCRRGAALFRNLPLLQAFNTWTSARRELGRLRGAYTRVVARALSRAFEQWEAAADSEFAREHALRRGTARIVQRELTAAVSLWKDIMREGQRRRKVGTRLAKRAVSAAFDHWCDLVDACERRLTLLRKGVARLLHRQLVSAINAWEMTRRRMQRLHGCVRAMVNQRRRRVWTTWTSYTEDQHSMRQQLLRAQNLPMLHAWRAWWTAAATRARAMAHVTRCVARIQLKQLSPAWSTWQWRVEQSDAQLAKVAMAVAHITHRGLALAYASWIESVSSGRGQGFWTDTTRKRAFIAWRGHAQLLTQISHALTRLTHRKLSAAFEQWEDATDELSDQAVALRRGAARFLQQALVGAHAVWRAHAVTVAKVRHAAVRISQRQLSAAFERWEEETDAANEQTAALRRGVARFVLQEICGGFAAWRAHTADTLKIRFVITRMTRRHMSAALERWAEATDGLAEEAAALRRGAARFVQQEVVSAFVSWRMHAQSMVRLRQAAARISQRQLSVMFEQWEEAVGAMKDRTAAMRRGANQFVQQGVSVAFSSWAATAAAHAAFTRSLRKGLSLLTQQKTRLSWNVWVEATAASSNNSGLIRRGLGFVVHRQLRLGWSSWVVAATADANAAQLLRRGLSFIVQQHTRRAWVSWIAAASALAASNTLLRRGVSSMVHAKTRVAWATWAHETAAHAVFMTRLRSGLRYISHRALATGLRSWQEAGRVVVQQQRAALIMLSAEHRHMAHAWESWMHGALLAERHERALRKGLAHLLQANLARGWVTWAASATAGIAHEKLLRRGLSALLHRERSRAWRSWREVAARRDASELQLLRMFHVQLTRGWNAWADDATRRGAMDMLLRRALARWTRGEFVNAVVKWRALAARAHRPPPTPMTMPPAPLDIPFTPPLNVLPLEVTTTPHEWSMQWGLFDRHHASTTVDTPLHKFTVTVQYGGGVSIEAPAAAPLALPPPPPSPPSPPSRNSWSPPTKLPFFPSDPRSLRGAARRFAPGRPRARWKP